MILHVPVSDLMTAPRQVVLLEASRFRNWYSSVTSSGWYSNKQNRCRQ